jgi:hypothetical protein
MAEIKDLLENEEVTVMQKKMANRGICRVCEQVCSSYFYYGAICCEGLWGTHKKSILILQFFKGANNFSAEPSFVTKSQNVPIAPNVI